MAAEATDIWQELESPPEEFESIADLYSWSLNYEAGKGPFPLLLDMVGWSEEHIGESLFSGPYSGALGYVEIGKLADALNAYAAHGSSAYAYIERLMELEAES